MQRGAGMIRSAIGVILVLLGGLWVLQGLDVLGGDGGMNGETIWAVIGALVLLAGAYVVYTGVQTRGRL